MILWPRATIPIPATPRSDYADPFLAALEGAADDCDVRSHQGEHGRVAARLTSSQAKPSSTNGKWNSDHGLPEAVTALRKMLALDPALRVLVAHGYSDLQTPYFESTLILNQLPEFGGRIAQRNYRGGHMFYSRDESRAAFRKDVGNALTRSTGQT